MTGLGNAAYTGSNDPAESTVYNKGKRTSTIYILASDVTLDGLTITVKYGKFTQFGIVIAAETKDGGDDNFKDIKIKNCVIRHLATNDKNNILTGILLSA